MQKLHVYDQCVRDTSGLMFSTRGVWQKDHQDGPHEAVRVGGEEHKGQNG